MLDYIKIILLLITCFVIFFTLIKLRNKKIKRVDLRFLLSSFFVTLLLAFIIEIKPHHLLRANFNIPNVIIYLFYFIIVGAYFIRYIKLIFQNKYVLIVLSYIFFGFVNALDLLSDGKIIELVHNEIIEDIFHILGIVFWLMFFIDFSKRINKINNHL